MKYEKRLTKQPRKKRLSLYNAPLHLRQKLVSAHLSKDLRAKEKKRSLPVRKGDKARVMRGRFKKREGKIVRVDLGRLCVFIEGVFQKKQGGKEILAPIQPSNVMIIELEKRKEKNG